MQFSANVKQIIVHRSSLSFTQRITESNPFHTNLPQKRWHKSKTQVRTCLLITRFTKKKFKMGAIFYQNLVI